jgi:hypothetical protein
MRNINSDEAKDLTAEDYGIFFIILRDPRDIL